MSDDGLHIPGISCDICQKSLLVEESVRYVVEIRVWAAYDPLEITRSDLRENHRAKIADLIEACRGVPEEDLESQVYRDFRFHLCPPCQRRYIRDPLRTDPDSQAARGGGGDLPVTEEGNDERQGAEYEIEP